MVAPGSRLQGASVNGASVDGSAAAPVSAPSGAVLIAPARTTPRPSSARRSIRPLPATAPTAADLVLRKRLTEPLMSSSLSALSGFVGTCMHLFEIYANGLIKSPYRVSASRDAVQPLLCR